MSTHFPFHDNTYDLAIARGLEHGFPPPDLSYAGESIQYHYGLPMLTELIHRATTLPYHTAFFAVLPTIFNLLTLASFFRLFRLLFTAWSLQRLLVATLLAQATVVLDGYNLVWNVLNLIRNGSDGLSTLHSVPITFIQTPSLGEEVLGGATLAVVMVLALLANIDRCGALTCGVSLFAIYVAKQQVLLPVIVAWATYGVLELFLRRRLSPIGGVLLGAGLIALAKVVTPSQVGYDVQPGFNDYFVRLNRAQVPFPSRLQDVPALGLAVALVSALVGLHIYGVALWHVYFRRPEQVTPAGRAVVLIAATYLLAGVALLTGTKLVMRPEVASRFDVIHDHVRDHLWLPPATYREDMMNISLTMVLAVWPALLCLLSTGAILQWHRASRSPVCRGVLTTICLIAIGANIWYWTHREAWTRPDSWHVVESSAADALQGANREPGVLLTNDLGFRHYEHLPLLNFWAPQLFGQQFYASNYMYGTFAHPDSLERLKLHEHFWSTPAGEWHRAFLRDKEITYLLVRRDLPFPPGLLTVPWLGVVRENEQYYLLRLKDGK
jgi:hypothetical protein